MFTTTNEDCVNKKFPLRSERRQFSFAFVVFFFFVFFFLFCFLLFSFFFSGPVGSRLTGKQVLDVHVNCLLETICIENKVYLLMFIFTAAVRACCCHYIVYFY